MKIQRKTNFDIRKNLRNIQKTELRVGFFESSKYEDGTPIAQVASIQEFGAMNKNIPPRPFMRPTLYNRGKWLTDIKKVTTRMAQGKLTPVSGFNIIGASVASDIKKSISDVQSPKLKESTIKGRLSRVSKSNKKNLTTGLKPLVDTGAMLNAVTYEVTQ